MDKRKIILISTAIFLLVVLASIFVAVLINKNRSQEISDQAYELTRTMSPGQSMAATITLAPTQRLVELEKINCTNPSIYWVYWSTELEKLGVMVSINEIQYSPDTMTSMISNASDDDIAEFLQQLYAAHLNLQQVTDPGDILTTVSDADQIFIEITTGNLEKENKDQLPELTVSLEKFNIGDVGPGLCPGAETLIESTATNTPTFSATPIWSSTPTSSLSPSLTPTRRVTLRPNTLTPTLRPPVYSNPTNTPVPPTPVPPTPVPTDPPPPDP